ncbi:hypothetical protein V8E53_011437 [Lactarius tabidus]
MRRDSLSEDLADESVGVGVGDGDTDAGLLGRISSVVVGCETSSTISPSSGRESGFASASASTRAALRASSSASLGSLSSRAARSSASFRSFSARFTSCFSLRFSALRCFRTSAWRWAASSLALAKLSLDLGPSPLSPSLALSSARRLSFCSWLSIRISRVTSFLEEDAGEGGTTGWGTRFNASRLISCPEGFLIVIFSLGTNAPALELRDVRRLAVESVGGGEVTDGD